MKSAIKTSQWQMNSPVGPIYLVASPNGLQGVLWRKSQAPFLTSLAGKEPAAQVLAKAVKQLSEYFAQERREFDLPFDIQGTDFQRRVWAELAKIPYGQTYSYRDIAQRIDQKKAMRAVGTANGRNPLSIVVPCHRVIAADGTLGGYAGGLEIKVKLLAIEGATFA